MYLVFTLLACLCFGAGTAMQKHGMAAAFPKLTVKTLFRRFGEIARTIVRNWVWTLGVLIQMSGGLFYLLAVSRGELTIVQPLINLTMVVAMLIGVFVLKEKIAANEVAGVLVLVGGAVLLGAAAPAEAAKRLDRGVYLIFTLGCTAVIVLSALLGQALKNKISPAYFFSATSGLCFGLGMVLANALLINLPPFSSTALGAFLQELLFSYELLPCVALNIIGFLYFQLSFAHGRVSIVSPINNITAALPPVAAGFTVFDEAVGALRLAGIITVLAGTLILVMKPEAAVAAGSPADARHP